MYKIAFDVMGADKGPEMAIEATIKFLKKAKDLHVVLVGDSEKINETLKNKKYNSEQISILPTTEEITMEDKILDIRRKKDSSMVVALELLAKKEVDGMLTGGNSALFIAGSHFILKEFEGVSRPGFMPTLPTIIKNKIVLLLDAGANLENDAEDLVNFAKLSSIYLKQVKKIENPKVGLLNIGEEESKGKELQREAYKLMKTTDGINFYGNIEPREITSGIVDVVVTDGFTGNIALKSSEGIAKNLLTQIKSAITKNLFRKINALFLKKAFKEVGYKFDYKNHAGAILIGVNGIAFKSHGSSDVKCFYATLRMTYEAVVNDVVNKMKEVI